MDIKQQSNNFFRLLALGKHSRVLYTAALAALSGAVILESAGNLIIRHIIDGILIPRRGFPPLLHFSLLFLASALVRGGLQFLAGRGRGKASEAVVRSLREKLYDHIQRLSFSYHDHSQTGELVQRSTSDVDTIRRFYAEQLPDLVRVIMLFLVNFTLLMILNRPLALISTVTVPVIALLSLIFFRLIFKAYDDYQEQEGILTTRVQENLSGIRVVRAFARQEWEKDLFRKINREQCRRGFILNLRHSCYWPLGHIICGLQFVTTLLVGGMMVIEGKMTPGTFVAFSSMVNAMIWPLQELGRMVTEFSKSSVSFSRIQEILREEQEELAHPRGREKDIPRIRGHIVMKDLTFRYGDGPAVLEGINLEVVPGSRIALLGATGSGKTTLVNLLPRYYEAPAGTITLDDRPLETYGRHFLRRNIGIVEQEPFLFTMTIRENIAFSLDREVTQDEIEAAARAAAIHDAIAGFPDGYDTLVGEKGVSLSGGQKQRIAIARTLLKDPAILIMDDSTSAVDAATEKSINAALDILMQDRTTFIIAHRIQTLERADKILVLHEGRIIEEGTHHQLIRGEGFYKNVFELQTRIEEELRQELSLAGVGDFIKE
jgi:ATP-binding cassette, subfamily B, bacterial